MQTPHVIEIRRGSAHGEPVVKSPAPRPGVQTTPRRER
jgi:hypothetical protein